MAQRRPIDVAVLKFYGATVITTVVTFAIIAVWVWLTVDSNGRGFPYLNTAFVLSWLITLVIGVVIMEYARRRPADAPVSWGEANVGAVVIFFLMFWVYGVVPHQWLTFADNELSWRADKALVGPSLPFTNDEGILSWALPFDLTYLVIRDIIAVTIYGFALAANVVMWRLWQERGTVAPTEVEASTYGRPLVREGA